MSTSPASSEGFTLKPWHMIVGGIALVLVLMVVLPLIGYWGCYSGLNEGHQEVLQKAADTDSALQRRNDLIPNLVETVKGYAAHEKEVLTAVTEARAKVSQINLNVKDAQKDPEKLKQLAAAQNELSSALSRLLVVSERYPDLKADKGFRDLQAQLEGTENRINVARQDYNAAAKKQNTRVNGLFSGWVARSNGFTEEAYFQADAGAHQAPKVNFGK